MKNHHHEIILELEEKVDLSIPRHYGAYTQVNDLIPLNIQGSKYRLFARIDKSMSSVDAPYIGQFRNEFLLYIPMQWDVKNNPVELKMDYQLFEYICSLEKGKLPITYESELNMEFSRFIRELIKYSSGDKEVVIISSDEKTVCLRSKLNNVVTLIMINTENFYSSYYKDTTKDKALPTASRIRFENGVVENVLLEDKEFTDAFRSSVQVLPFTSNPSTSNYDRSCGLRGITGEFFRKSKDRQTKAISDFENNAIQPVRNYLLQQKHMKEKQVEEFIEIMKDVMYSDGSLTIIDPSFLKFLPLTDGNTNSKKYEHGQRSIAEYLSSMLCPKDLLVDMLSKKPNLFNEIIISALSSSTGTGGSNENEYIILPFIKEAFGEDLKWFLKRDDSIVVKYIHVFLHFYLCYSLSQTLVYLDYRKYNIVPEKPQKMYYILTSEHASEGREAVTNGWNKYVNKEALEKSFGRIEALDILNSLLDGNIGFYNDVYNKLKEQDFNDEIKMLLEDVICSYQRDKREQLKKREVAKFQFPDEVSTEVNSYDDFILKLGLLCTTLQSKEYESKMKIRVNNIMKIRMLSTRRGREILNLDDEMLFFLMAMISKGTRMKLEDLYEGFGKYGVAFDYDTKAAIENYLLKLNLLERKSDSGEAQYVKIVL